MIDGLLALADVMAGWEIVDHIATDWMAEVVDEQAAAHGPAVSAMIAGAAEAEALGLVPEEGDSK